MNRDGGTRRFWLATSVSGICTRSAARNRISLITFGHASASTQIAMFSPFDNSPYCRLLFLSGKAADDAEALALRNNPR
jgi:hypothetical protein